MHGQIIETCLGRVTAIRFSIRLEKQTLAVRARFCPFMVISVAGCPRRLRGWVGG